ncbi:MAG: hypothetical protein AAF618_10415, partial [Pseudomonadota bacterium]
MLEILALLLALGAMSDGNDFAEVAPRPAPQEPAIAATPDNDADPATEAPPSIAATPDAPPTIAATPTMPGADPAEGLRASYPEFSAGLNDCLLHITGSDAPLGQEGQVLGGGESYAIFYPVQKSDFDFVVSIATLNGARSCSGQGPRSLPTAELDAELPALAATLAPFSMSELNFPAPTRAFADCAGQTAMLFSDSGGTIVFAGFLGDTAQTYCS